MTFVRFIKCYSNPVITLIAAILFLVFSGDTEVAVRIDSDEVIEEMGLIYALSAITFSLLAVWVFSIGALIVLAQLIYGLVKYFSVKENRAVYLHYFYGFGVSIFSYAIIFSGSV